MGQRRRFEIRHLQGSRDIDDGWFTAPLNPFCAVSLHHRGAYAMAIDERGENAAREDVRPGSRMIGLWLPGTDRLLAILSPVALDLQTMSIVGAAAPAVAHAPVKHLLESALLHDDLLLSV